MKSLLKEEKKGVILCLTVMLLLGASLRLYGAGYQSLWTDEISSAIIASSNISEILSRNLSPDKADIPVEEPPLLYILMHYSMKISENELMVRLPSVLFGILSILAIFLVARLFYGDSVALFSAFLLSISLYHILYSQEARGYSAHIFFSLLSLFFIWKAATQGDIRSWIGFTVSTTLNIYSHYSAFQVFAIETLIFIIILSSLGTSNGKIPFPQNKKDNIIKYIQSVLAIVVLSLPLLKNFLQVMSSRLGGETIPFELNLQYFANLLARYGAGNGEAFYAYNIFFLTGITWAFMSNKKKEILTMILWLTFPFFVLTYTGYKYFFHIRYVIFTFPIYLIIVANGVVGLYESRTFQRIVQKLTPWNAVHPGWIYGAICLVLFVWLNTTPLRLYYQMPARMTDWKGIAKYIKENYQPGTLILIESSFCIRELGYYLKDTEPRIEVCSVNGDIDKFREVVLGSDNVWYVDCNPVFDSVVLDLFKDRITFASPVFAELGKRELIDWNRSWFPSSIRRYYPTLYYNNVHYGTDFLEVTSCKGTREIEKWAERPQLVKRRERRLWVRSPLSEKFRLNCVNCEYEVLEGEGVSNSALLVHFDGGPEEEEYVEIELPVDKPIDLNRYPVLEVTYKLKDSDTQVIEVVGGIDYTGDGIEDGCVRAYTRSGENVIGSKEGYKCFSVGLFGIANEEFPKKKSYLLTALKVRARKSWGKDLREKEGIYTFQFKDAVLHLRGTAKGFSGNHTVPCPKPITIKVNGKKCESRVTKNYRGNSGVMWFSTKPVQFRRGYNRINIATPKADVVKLVEILPNDPHGPSVIVHLK